MEEYLPMLYLSLIVMYVCACYDTLALCDALYVPVMMHWLLVMHCMCLFLVHWPLVMKHCMCLF